ncbi:MAG: hypothetical protein L6R37_007308 [Teloschistes peruensis]|nr:MAG: hypothetical protein L6R37_007308 [Teloschistes peruensis]
MKIVLALPLVFAGALHAIPRLAQPLSVPDTTAEQLPKTGIDLFPIPRSLEQTPSIGILATKLTTSIDSLHGQSPGYPDVLRRPTSSRANARRHIPTVEAEEDTSMYTLSPVLFIKQSKDLTHARTTLAPRADPDIYIDVRPQWSRLDFRAVQAVLLIAEHWASSGVNDTSPYNPIPNNRYETTLFEGAEVAIRAAPGKFLTYHVAQETFQRLLKWEWEKGKGKAAQFGIMRQKTLLGAGEIKKGKVRGVEVEGQPQQPPPPPAVDTT